MLALYKHVNNDANPATHDLTSTHSYGLHNQGGTSRSTTEGMKLQPPTDRGWGVGGVLIWRREGGKSQEANRALKGHHRRLYWRCLADGPPHDVYQACTEPYRD